MRVARPSCAETGPLMAQKGSNVNNQKWLFRVATLCALFGARAGAVGGTHGTGYKGRRCTSSARGGRPR